jgi:hypothetical protein
MCTLLLEVEGFGDRDILWYQTGVANIIYKFKKDTAGLGAWFCSFWQCDSCFSLVCPSS